MEPTSPLSFVLLGAGSRGNMFSQWLHDNVGAGSVVAVAEPDAERRERARETHNIPAERCYESWDQLLAEPKLADVAINTTNDKEHIASAIAAMKGGYHMLLEKPMATSYEDCVEIDRVRRETGRIVSVCHSLRYHSLYAEIRRILRAGTIGEIVSLDQLEGVGHIHQSHSFVRGNWANQERSTFMLLAKSCHDIDIIADLVDIPCEKVSSYGELKFFNRNHMPAGAPDYCVEGCPSSAKCPYYAPKIYGEGTGWAHPAGLASFDKPTRLLKLASSPYGRCVFKTDNDVVDHQVVAMEFEGGVTATFTMTAFTPMTDRYIRIHGTKGYIEAKIESRTLDMWEFWEDNRHSQITLPEVPGDHGGADAEVMRSLISAIQLDDPSSVPTSTYASLRSHAIVFAAEQSRRTGRAVDLREVGSMSTR